MSEICAYLEYLFHKEQQMIFRFSKQDHNKDGFFLSTNNSLIDQC